MKQSKKTKCVTVDIARLYESLKHEDFPNTVFLMDPHTRKLVRRNSVNADELVLYVPAPTGSELLDNLMTSKDIVTRISLNNHKTEEGSDANIQIYVELNATVEKNRKKESVSFLAIGESTDSILTGIYTVIAPLRKTVKLFDKDVIVFHIPDKKAFFKLVGPFTCGDSLYNYDRYGNEIRTPCKSEK